MSDGKRDVDPQGTNGSQDVYARVASAAASRSGDGSSRPAGPKAAPAKTAPVEAATPARAAAAKTAASAEAAPAKTTAPVKAAAAKPAPAQPAPAKPVPAKPAPAKRVPAKAAPAQAVAAKTAPATAPAQAGPATPKHADPKPAAAARPAAAVAGSPDAEAFPTAAGAGSGPTWKARLGAVSRRVLGTDEVKPAGSPPDPSSTEATAVVALPTVSRAVPAVPAARTTGTRIAPVPAPAGGTKAAQAETLDTDQQPKAKAARRTRKARLRLSRLDPWSVMKTAFMFSIAGGIMLVVGVYAIWTVISGSGLFDNVNDIIASVVSTPGDTTPFRVEDYINTPKVMGVTAFLACIDVVIFTALATLGSFLYNLAATMLGGLEITLAED